MAEKIAREYGQLVKTTRGVTVKIDQSKARARVKTVVPMDEETQVQLCTALKDLVGTEVELINVIDPSILGGIVVHLGDTIIDMSLATRLNDLDKRIHQELTRQFGEIPATGSA